MSERRNSRNVHKRIHRRGRRRKKGFLSWSLGKKIGVIFSVTLVSVLVIGLVSGAMFIAGKMEKLDTTQKLDAEELEITQEVEHRTGYLNVALFGVDSRDANLGKGTRSDTIMIASLNQETGEVRLCSVYRDTLLKQDDGSFNKANAAYSFGGVEDAVALLNKNLDMNIEHYVTVNFNALIDVVDLLGGVDIDVSVEEVYLINGYCRETSKVTKHDFEDLKYSGPQTLDGVQATSYCRIRQTKGDDFKRTERQRAVIEQIVKKLQNSNLATINKVVDAAFEEVGTNFTLPEILSYAKDFMKFKLGETAGFPFDKTTDRLAGTGDTVIPTDLESNVIKLHEFLFGTEENYTPSSVVTGISNEIKKRTGNMKATDYDLTDSKKTDSGNTDNDQSDETTGNTTSGGTQNKKPNKTQTGQGNHSGTGNGGTGGDAGGGTGNGGAGGDAGGGTGNGGGDEGGGTGSSGGDGGDAGGDAGGGAGEA